MQSRKKLLRPPASRDEILNTCLGAFVKAGTLDLSLDELAAKVGSSKRMLIHYFGGRESIEEGAMSLLEDRLRIQFRADTFPPGTPLGKVVDLLWERATSAESRGVLLLVMDLTRRAWSGSARARKFYREQQRLWVEMLMAFSNDRRLVESVLTLFQGAVLAYLVTGNRDRGRRAIEGLLGTRAETA